MPLYKAELDKMLEDNIAPILMLTGPLRELYKKGVHIKWQPRLQEALDAVKLELCKTTTL